MACHKLDAILCRFFAEIRKKDGQDCELESLAVMQCSLDRHLKNCGRNYSILRDRDLQIQGNNLKRKQENYELRVPESEKMLLMLQVKQTNISSAVQVTLVNILPKL